MGTATTNKVNFLLAMFDLWRVNMIVWIQCDILSMNIQSPCKWNRLIGSRMGGRVSTVAFQPCSPDSGTQQWIGAGNLDTVVHVGVPAIPSSWKLLSYGYSDLAGWSPTWPGSGAMKRRMKRTKANHSFTGDSNGIRVRTFCHRWRATGKGGGRRQNILTLWEKSPATDRSVFP